ncbi:sensor histidine kinase [Nonomuraea sp. SBT364]|uniref:sensor histidine kinase n=1 Tax=Nonomuraea sp. SBT364 TaxID=1580530 RepID=UPI00066A94A9|nr:nitrate- and nitrite sensing domain-containing protein [Nonomuraea sp. SBT364]
MKSAPPIRRKILRILLVPLVSLVALWGYIAYSMVSETSGFAQSRGEWDAVGAPSRDLIIALQRERLLTAELAGRAAGDTQLGTQRQATDQAVARVRDVAAGLAEQPQAGTAPETVQALLKALDGLSGLRAAADLGDEAPLVTTEKYNVMISVANRQFGGAERITEVSSYRVLRGLSAYSSASEYASREAAVLAPALERGQMTRTEHAAFVAAMTARRVQLADALRDIGPELRAWHEQLAATTAYQRFEQAEDAVYGWNVRGIVPVTATSWRLDSAEAFAGLSGNAGKDLRRATLKGEGLVFEGLVRIGVVLGLGLLAVLLSIVLSYRFGRSMINELKKLQGSAVELAEVRLPKLVERLRKGEDVDPAEMTTELERARTAEVERVVQAFSAVQHTAVEAAVGQATLRKGVGQVFLNLARRNQALLHRQLTLLDAMERKAEDPDTLEGLFKLDHFTTRMRRHAENLIILSDAAPGRRWRDPVPIHDVIRSAALEVEDYTRVTIQPMPQAPMLAGAAVTDVIHLIAELIENATAFSPPNTSVQVRGLAAANGFAIEVEDRGLGMNAATMAELNAQLATPPEFDLAGSDRMGIFVVSRLAARHGIKVTLRPSPYDGTTAILMVPVTVLTEPVQALPHNTVSLFEPVSTLPSRPVPAPSAVRPLPPPPPPPVPAPRHETDDDLDGLPVRVRQASLAPQLRKTRPRQEPDVSTRSPQELHDLMTSMQEGWRQGRKEAEESRDVRNERDTHGRREI